MFFLINLYDLYILIDVFRPFKMNVMIGWGLCLPFICFVCSLCFYLFLCFSSFVSLWVTWRIFIYFWFMYSVCTAFVVVAWSITLYYMTCYSLLVLSFHQIRWKLRILLNFFIFYSTLFQIILNILHIFRTMWLLKVSIIKYNLENTRRKEKSIYSYFCLLRSLCY